MITKSTRHLDLVDIPEIENKVKIKQIINTNIDENIIIKAVNKLMSSEYFQWL